MGTAKGFFSVTMILSLVAIVSLLAIGGYFMMKYKDALHDADTLRQEKAAAQARATALALLWAKTVDQAEEKANARVRETQRGYDSLLARAKAVNRGAGVVLGRDVGKLLLDASRFANNTPAAAEGDQAPPDVVSNAPQAKFVTFDEPDFAAYLVGSAAAYRDAVGQWQACVDFYESLRTQEQLH